MIKKLYIFIALTGLLNTFAQTTITDSIISGGIYRSYILYVPAIYTGTNARPLIINMHGYTSNAQQQQLYSNFMPIADTANFLMVYPNGTYSSGQRFWNAGLSATLVDDIGFISHLIDSLKAQYNIDMNAVYSTGMSNGGFMSHTLACELSNRITAIASVTGSIFTTQYGSYCHPGRPVPVMQIHGTADPTVPYAGNTSQGMVPVDSVVKYWVTKNGCNPTPVFTNVPNTNTSDGCTAEHYVYNGGNLGSTCELYKIIGGAHTWPGSPFTIGVTNQDFSASVEIWRFFRKYRLNTLTSVSTIDKENTNFKLYPNPANDLLNFSFNGNDYKAINIDITDVLGNTIIHEANSSGKINIAALTTGIYFLSLTSEGKEVVKAKFIKE
ncbi:MAG: T9SS type A sorting domain-containing protein [Bacteroidota bacterium]